MGILRESSLAENDLRFLVDTTLNISQQGRLMAGEALCEAGSFSGLPCTRQR